ncbi:hypothetical protein FOA43_001051 [Brettanomyces nanus]|uniref:Uncharacterized protein n=1 Tax=Eeniella nana TaxID=13502 RepID=A0A875RYF3_EENNA|nr:uncharacterized protein FOA43_001051 [Brettanomyces nanus]QPG73738.1 hypothetical protein FOA43_001051 [Brettanomyces nanus]
MWRLVQTGLSVVAGTAEPEYGPDSIRPVGSDLKEGEKCYSDLTREEMHFRAPEYTNVETQVFYFEDEIWSGFAQIIHSNMVGLHTTAQFTFKIFKKEEPEKYVWTSTHLNNFHIDNGTDFFADDLSIVLSEDGTTYTINSSVNLRSEVIDLKLVHIGQGIKFGKDGTTYYGLDPENPWGSMRHIFWPRCHVSGEIVTREYRQPELDEQSESGEYLELDSTDAKLLIKEESAKLTDALGMYVMALQGMKPQHAAASWDFLNYQSPEYSVVLMEFTTPPSYNRTTVSTAMIVDKEGKVVLCSLDNKTEHLDTFKDEYCGWMVPRKVSYTLKGVDEDGVETVAVISADLKRMSERVDVMSEIPQFVKNIVSAAAGTKPFIYQFSNTMNLLVKVNGEQVINEDGYGYSETTFIRSASCVEEPHASQGDEAYDLLLSPQALSSEESEWVLFGAQPEQNQQCSEILSFDDESIVDHLDDFTEFRDQQDIKERRNITNERIERWRRDQVNVLVSELVQADSGRMRDSEARDLIKTWTFAERGVNRIGICTSIDKYYGDCIIRGYGEDDIIVIKQVLSDFSQYLKCSIKERRRSSVESRAALSCASMSSSKMMNNPCLDKYIPMFLRNLIEKKSVEKFWDEGSLVTSESIVGY